MYLPIFAIYRHIITWGLRYPQNFLRIKFSIIYHDYKLWINILNVKTSQNQHELNIIEKNHFCQKPNCQYLNVYLVILIDQYTCVSVSLWRLGCLRANKGAILYLSKQRHSPPIPPSYDKTETATISIVTQSLVRKRMLFCIPPKIPGSRGWRNPSGPSSKFAKSHVLCVLPALLGATRLIQSKTSDYSQTAFIARVSGFLRFFCDRDEYTHCWFYSLSGGLPRSLLQLIDHSVAHYNINRMFYMPIKTKCERSYSEALTGSIQAAATLNAEQGEMLEGMLRLLRSFKGGGVSWTF